MVILKGTAHSRRSSRRRTGGAAPLCPGRALCSPRHSHLPDPRCPAALFPALLLGVTPHARRIPAHSRRRTRSKTAAVPLFVCVCIVPGAAASRSHAPPLVCTLLYPALSSAADSCRNGVSQGGARTARIAGLLQHGTEEGCWRLLPRLAANTRIWLVNWATCI